MSAPAAAYRQALLDAEAQERVRSVLAEALAAEMIASAAVDDEEVVDANMRALEDAIHRACDAKRDAQLLAGQIAARHPSVVTWR